jgi:hypothetical protein
MDTKTVLVKTRDGWGLSLAATPEADSIQSLFGTMILPLPLTLDCPPDRALNFALNTDFGRQYGVRAMGGN